MEWIIGIEKRERERIMNLKFAKQIDGTDKGEIFLFTLSTCGWCFKTKTLLKELGVRYSYVDMDLLDDAEAEQAEAVIRKYTPRAAFPTVIINQKDCIIGYDPDKLRDLFEN